MQRYILSEVQQHGGQIWEWGAEEDRDPDTDDPRPGTSHGWVLAVFRDDDLLYTQHVQLRSLLALWRRGLIDVKGW